MTTWRTPPDTSSPLRRRYADVRLTIVGRGSRPDIERLRAADVDVRGEVADLRAFLRRAAVVVVPIRMGGGTRFKVLEALAMGRPVVSTTVGCEGVDVADDKHLLIGFRNPIPRGRALVVPLLNPNQVINGSAAQFGEPSLLNLGGQGIRDIGHWHGKYLIVGGSYDAEGVSRVYLWNGGSSQPQPLRDIDLSHFNPEAVVVYPHNPLSFQLLSDDGTQLIDGIPCKRLPNSMKKSFRAIWVTPPGGN